MSVYVVAPADVAMWVRDHYVPVTYVPVTYVPVTYARAAWTRRTPFLQLPGRIVWAADAVYVVLHPYYRPAVDTRSTASP